MPLTRFPFFWGDSLVDFALKVVQWSESETVRLQLWDIAGMFTRSMRLLRSAGEALNALAFPPFLLFLFPPFLLFLFPPFLFSFDRSLLQK